MPPARVLRVPHERPALRPVRELSTGPSAHGDSRDGVGHEPRLDWERGSALPSDDEDDQRLMVRVADGDAAAFRMLVERHTASLVAHATRMLRNPSEAEEVVQETYVRLWKNAPNYRPEAKLRTFMYGIAHNLCIDRLRARKKHDPDALEGLSSGDRTSGSIHELELRARCSVRWPSCPSGSVRRSAWCTSRS